MAARAHEISLEAGSKMAAAMKDVINAAAGLTGFAVESARDLVQYMVRRGQMTQDEADKLIREAEEAHGKKNPGFVAPPRRADMTADRSAPRIVSKPVEKPAIVAAPPAPPKAAAPAAAPAKVAASKAHAAKAPVAKKPAPAAKKAVHAKGAVKRPAVAKASAKPAKKK